jgi:diacylglycerol kinase (ATP)
MDLHRTGTNGSSHTSCGPLTDYYIPDYILKPDSEQVIVDNAPSCPVVVFINSRSGGQLGSSLIKTYRELLNESQVNRLPVWKSCDTENYVFPCTVLQ